jgi:hypothetical protein
VYRSSFDRIARVITFTAQNTAASAASITRKKLHPASNIQQLLLSHALAAGDTDFARPPLRQASTTPTQIMNGSHIKQAAIQKAKQVANASNGNANKKRKKELKPIITTEGQQEKAQSQSQEKDAEGASAASNMASSNQPAAG